MIEIATRAIAMPVVDLLLQGVTRLQQLAIDRCQFVDQCLETGPESGRLHIDRGQDLFFDKIEKGRVDLKTTDVPPAFFSVAHGTRLVMRRTVLPRCCLPGRSSRTAHA